MSDNDSTKATEYSSSSGPQSKSPTLISKEQKSNGSIVPAIPSSTDSGDESVSTATIQTKKKSRATSLFNSRINASTDNISLSSTVSSASVMIRKLGSMGKLARRNSLAGITSLFKDRDKNKAKDDRKGNKKGGKGEASEASISHVTAELDRMGADWSADMKGLSPAAKLARQHTLKTNAEAAARAKATQEATKSVAPPPSNGIHNEEGVSDVSTTSGLRSSGKSKGGLSLNEDCVRMPVESNDGGSDECGDVPQQAGQNVFSDDWDDDEVWEEGEEVDEDMTIRVGLERRSLDDCHSEDHEPWAINIRRSLERARRPTKGILKHAESYDQHMYLSEPQTSNRLRSNSYNSHPGAMPELGPLAHLPSEGPDHIDGIHKPNVSPSISPKPTLPPLSFDSSTSVSLSPKEILTPVNNLSPATTEKSIFNLPNLNSSAPALSTMMSSQLPLTHRSSSASSSGKRLMFASNLSVYDTFPASVYDRRSEPATWSRLTPALAQRIKEELNSYKMEEMEVHASSRIHTQFFV